jgi:hypothetical protein
MRADVEAFIGAYRDSFSQGPRAIAYNPYRRDGGWKILVQTMHDS